MHRGQYCLVTPYAIRSILVAARYRGSQKKPLILSSTFSKKNPFLLFSCPCAVKSKVKYVILLFGNPVNFIRNLSAFSIPLFVAGSAQREIEDAVRTIPDFYDPFKDVIMTLSLSSVSGLLLFPLAQISGWTKNGQWKKKSRAAALLQCEKDGVEEWINQSSCSRQQIARKERLSSSSSRVHGFKVQCSVRAEQE
jgi:hypothetical protein